MLKPSWADWKSCWLDVDADWGGCFKCTGAQPKGCVQVMEKASLVSSYVPSPAGLVFMFDTRIPRVKTRG